MKQFFILLLLFPLSFSFTDKDSVNNSFTNQTGSDYTKWIFGLGIGKYVDCKGNHDYQNAGVLFKRYKQNGFTYGGSFNIIRGLSENDFMPAVNGNVGYNHEYFEVSGGVGFPNLLNASIRLGPENCNLNAQAFSSVPLISGEGFGSAGVSITQYFEAGLSFGIPQGYYFSGILPINESNKIRLTYKISREYKEEFGFSISLIHFNF
ncbi:MAG: hypothetical protein M1480_00675 [Bacteroidetes bacterium]|nr:hypothetical protein [Bacteroidota bacterium]